MTKLIVADKTNWITVVMAEPEPASGIKSPTEQLEYYHLYAVEKKEVPMEIKAGDSL